MNFAQALTEDLLSHVKTVTAFKDKSVAVYSPEDLMDKAKMVRPIVGVLYEGARSVDNGNEKSGASGEAVFTLILLTETSVVSGLVNTKPSAHAYLDDLRLAIQGRRAIHGHPWRWVMEAPAAQKNGATMWLQRFRVPIQVVPAPNARSS
jgi:hypothetical protein